MVEVIYARRSDGGFDLRLGAKQSVDVGKALEKLKTTADTGDSVVRADKMCDELSEEFHFSNGSKVTIADSQDATTLQKALLRYQSDQPEAFEQILDVVTDAINEQFGTEEEEEGMTA